MPHSGKVERFDCRIQISCRASASAAERIWSGAILRHVRLCNGQLPQSVPRGQTPVGALKNWQRDRPELFRKQPYDHAGCDS